MISFKHEDRKLTTDFKKSIKKPKEVQIVYRLFLVNWYLLHVSRLPSQPASSGRGWVIDFIWLEMPQQYIAMTRNKLFLVISNNLSIILNSLWKPTQFLCTYVVIYHLLQSIFCLLWKCAYLVDSSSNLGLLELLWTVY